MAEQVVNTDEGGVEERVKTEPRVQKQLGRLTAAQRRQQQQHLPANNYATVLLRLRPLRRLSPLLLSTSL
ncbi:hypothetical protein EYF80_053267 [Liparis tanakae]|uniref:Uncharacterized protein n=1 Tax=Liparis tanakae TaxID=230148 RepID=A0A4Z2F5Q3_9TELE|nr:hypothetical protein EYF80_053267 [Liparis tanakae]